MIYKYKFYLNINKYDDEHELTKTVVLNEDYLLTINIMMPDFEGRIKINILILNRNASTLDNVVVERSFIEFRNSIRRYDLIRICQTYVLKNEDDIFMIKIFSPDITLNLISHKTDETILNEIQITDFENELELMDLSALMICHAGFISTWDLFISKSLYFGLKSAKELLEYTNEKNLRLEFEKSTPNNLKALSQLFYKIAVLIYESKEFRNILNSSNIDDKYSNLKSLRLSALNKYYTKLI